MQSTREPVIPEAAPHSITALAVAMGFVRALEMDYLYLFSQQELALAKHFYETGLKALPEGDNKELANKLNRASYRLQQGFFYVAIAMGYDPLILLRKLMIRNKIESAIQSGVKQVVYLGSGYDIRSLVASLAHLDVNFYEIDRGLTRDCKLDGIATIPAELGIKITMSRDALSMIKINNNLMMIDCDLSVKDLGETLYAHGFNPNLKTLIIAEGLTAYLSCEDNQRLLNSVLKIFKDGDELLLSYISGLMNSSVQDKATNQTKEKLLFPLAPDKVIPFSAANGFDVTRRFCANDLLGELGAYVASTFYWVFSSKSKEHYYLLTKSMMEHELTRAIETVPLIDCTIPPKPAVSRCSIL